jgi:multicomponent Na+:H+ antiporter subunit F
MPLVLVVPALVWITGLIVIGGVVPIRARDVLQRVVALDLLSMLAVALLTLLSYAQRQSYYFDVAVALALLSFVATVAAARYLRTRRTPG